MRLSLKGLKYLAGKRAPIILHITAIAGYGLACYSAAKATPKYLSLLDKKKEELKESGEEITVKDRLVLGFKVYWPTFLMFGGSTAAVLYGDRINEKRLIAASTALAISEQTASEYQKKVIEKFGEKKESEVCQEVAQEKLDKNPVSKQEVVFAGGGEWLFYEPLSRHYFRSTAEQIRKVQNDCNWRMSNLNEMYLSVDDWIANFGAPPLAAGLGQELGFNVDQPIDITFTYGCADNGEPCAVIDYLVAPKYNYSKLY